MIPTCSTILNLSASSNFLFASDGLRDLTESPDVVLVRIVYVIILRSRSLLSAVESLFSPTWMNVKCYFFNRISELK